MSIRVDIKSNDPRWLKILCYPKPKEEEASRRKEELASLGIKLVEFIGRSSINGVNVLGKGCVSVAVLAYGDQARYALKIRRVDANRESMEHEAALLRFANKLGVGPRLIGFSKNFLVMEYVDGLPIDEWLLKKQPATIELKRLLLNLLTQCRKMDKAGLSHGELSTAKRHVIVAKDGTPYIIDFETSSLTRKASNVTAICSYLLTRSQASSKVTSTLNIQKTEVFNALRAYKHSITDEAFNRLLGALNLISEAENLL
ncbi:MAG: RIO1 family regulatory kinase/ATPase [Candidatus Nezhaarchaeales archaeon]